MEKEEQKGIIFALTLNHDTGVVAYRVCGNALKNRNGIIKDRFLEENLFCINEERLNRSKFTRAFPYLSIEEAKHYFHINKQNNNCRVLIASKFTPIFLLNCISHLRKVIKKESVFSYFFNLYVSYQIFLLKCRPIAWIEESLNRFLFAKRLSVNPLNLQFIEHHQCHAAAAFYTSGMDKALVITIDAEGDGISATVSIGKGRSLTRIFSEDGWCGIGTFYAKITELLGFRPNRHEGKITGLAAYGHIRKPILNIMKNIFSFDEKHGRFTRINYLFDIRRTSSIYKRLLLYERKDVAATAQHYFESEICKFISYWKKSTGCDGICLAGGLFANVKLNQRIHELQGIKEIYIFPHMGDGGIAFGALMEYLKPKPQHLKTCSLGPKFDDKEILHALGKAKAKYSIENEIEKKVAGLIAKGKVIAWFDGRMEFGPRALGNRSVLYQATDRFVNDWLNKKLKRTEFMPFAPVVLKEHADRCFNNLSGAENAARFMTITFECTKFMKEKCPGVVHVDGTARPQIISKKDNPYYYQILKHYYELTGIPAIINTSFNMHEEPIVCTPDEAILAFRKAGLDYLVLSHKYLVSK